jgi:hypothetical protein
MFMYVTTIASLLVTAYNIYVNVYQPNIAAGRVLPVIGSRLMVLVALLLVAAAIIVGIDGGGCSNAIVTSPSSSRARLPRGPERLRFRVWALGESQDSPLAFQLMTRGRPRQHTSRAKPRKPPSPSTAADSVPLA